MIGLRELRLLTGLVLLAFLLTHFANHSLGLVSVDAMEIGRRWFNVLWRNPVGTFLLYGSLLAHFMLALEALYRRRTLRMPAREIAQLALGVALPFLIIPHVVGTRINLTLTGEEVSYFDVVRGLWINAPQNGLRQAVALVVAWFHGSLGMYFWLRHRPWFSTYSTPLYTVAVLVPVLALLGFAEAGKELTLKPIPRASPGGLSPELKANMEFALYLGFAALIFSVLGARALRTYQALSARLRVTYPGGRAVVVPKGFSVLEASRSAGIPHVSVCGGRGRCSTCRVKVLDGLEGQPEPEAQERATLLRIKAGPMVRLACQFRPVHDLTVAPVLSPGRMRLLTPGSRAARGREREVAVLFCDLRGFTGLTERRLPFDIVFILNRYFEVVGHAVEAAGGYVDKFIGDGALALFGLETTAEIAARQAIEAALGISKGVKELNQTYASELDRPLQIAMSLHIGPAIVGEMGYGQATNLTAVGDTINTASRLEGVAKDLEAELLISDELAKRSGIPLAAYERQTLKMRGRSLPVEVWIVRDASGLAAETMLLGE